MHRFAHTCSHEHDFLKVNKAGVGNWRTAWPLPFPADMYAGYLTPDRCPEGKLTWLCKTLRGPCNVVSIVFCGGSRWLMVGPRDQPSGRLANAFVGNPEGPVWCWLDSPLISSPLHPQGGAWRCLMASAARVECAAHTPRRADAQ